MSETSAPIQDGECATRPATSKWLGLGDSGARFRLPDDANVDYLEAVIKAAMRAGDAVTVEVQSDDPAVHSRVILGGSALALVVLSERSD